MTNSNLVPKKITDKNGKATTVRVNPNKGAKTNDKAGKVSTPVVAAAAAAADNTAAVLDEVKDYIYNHSFELTNVDGRDSLSHSEESMQAYLVGDQDTLDANVRFGYQSEENLRESAIYEIKHILTQRDVEWYDLDADEQDELVSAVESMDTSDILYGLVSNTPAQLVKLDFDDAYNAVAEYVTDSNGDTDWDKHNHIMFGGNDNYDDRVAFLSSYLEGKGFKTHTSQGKEAIEEIIGNGNYDWHSDLKIGLTFRTPLADVNVGEIVGGEEKDERALIFKELVNVGMIDRMNGSGWVAEFEPTSAGARFVVDKSNPVSLDSVGANGWDSITGGTWGMDTKVESEWTY